MDNHEYQYILSVAEQGSISKAARALHISQPALSSSIAKIEGNIGVKLFNRKASPIKLTYAGEKYVDMARKVLLLNRKFEEDMQAMNENSIGQLTVCCSCHRNSMLLPYVLPTFCQKYPGIELKFIETGDSFRMAAEVTAGNAALGFFPVCTNYFDDLAYEQLAPERLYFVTPLQAPDMALADNKRLIDWSKLKDEKFISARADLIQSKVIEFLFNEYGASSASTQSVQNNQTAIALVAAGCGVALVPGGYLLTTPCRADVRVYELFVPSAKWNFCAVYPKNSYITQPMRLFINLVQERMTALWRASDDL